MVVAKKRKIPSSTDSKILKELKDMKKLLKEIKDILDKQWRQIAA